VEGEMENKIVKLYRLMRAINQEIVRSVNASTPYDEASFFEHLCNIVVEHFVKFAFIGFYIKSINTKGKIKPGKGFYYRISHRYFIFASTASTSQENVR